MQIEKNVKPKVNWLLSSYRINDEKEDNQNDKSSHVYVNSSEKQNNEWNITPKGDGYTISLAKDNYDTK